LAAEARVFGPRAESRDEASLAATDEDATALVAQTLDVREAVADLPPPAR
jgi:hypothetical protein